MLIINNYLICLMVDGIIGFSDMLSVAQTVGIVGTMILTLIFSKRHIQSLSKKRSLKMALLIIK
jgi:hypothetical protein